MIACLDGVVGPAAHARVDVLDRGFLYGDGAFEVLRAVGGRPVDLAWHLERLARATDLLGLPHVPEATWRADVRAALGACTVGDAHVRLVLTRGSGDPAAGLAPAPGRPTRLVLARALAAAELERVERPLAATVLDRHRPDARSLAPSVKTCNVLPSILAIAEARARGADEALLTAPGGDVVEGASSNVFVVEGGRVRTPPLAAGCLDGVTRRRVLALAATAGIACEEARLPVATVRRAGEIFVTSSIRGVVPVVRLDGVTVGDGDAGPITRVLRARYGAFLVDIARGAL